MTTLTLRAPLRVLDREVHAITFREPTGNDLIECGFPLRMGEGEARPDPKSIAALIARLCNLTPDAPGRMHAGDFNAAMGIVLGFLGPSIPEPRSTSISTSRDTGATSST